MNKINYDDLFENFEEEGEIKEVEQNEDEDGDIIDDDFEDDNNKEISKSKKKSKKWKKKKERFDIQEVLSEEGNISISLSPDNNMTFITKIKNTDFTTNHQLFEKGRANSHLFQSQDMETIPNINFWNQRYYYFSKFDE